MNKSEFLGVKTHVKNIEYNFQEPQKDGYIELEIKDEIEINEMTDEYIKTSAIRKLIFKNIENTFLNVTFDMNIKISKPITKDCFIEKIKNGKGIISANVYSKISLLISNITNMCPLGTIITPPTYDAKEIIIK